MRGSLSEYRKKRDFGVTSEPKGAVTRATKRLSFVIQKHAARRLHYDFRLELDGTLKSWAVPKGPSLDPHVRRMAVHVEDHPLGYANFEGVIPPGQYGAGTVIVWDRGEWVPLEDPRAGYRKGKLKFDLHGEKLRGRWNLVRMHGRAGERQEPWLLIKETDEEARPASEYDIVEAEPDSVVAGLKTGKKKTREKKTTAKKLRADRLGKETEQPMNDWIDIGAFAKAPAKPDPKIDAKVGVPLYLEKQRIHAGAQKVTIIVDQIPYRAGIDPLHKLIDRVTNDNTVGVRDRTRLGGGNKKK